jgi:hypothetical protein
MLGSVIKKGRLLVPFDKLVAALDGWTYLKQLVVKIRRQLEESVTLDIVVITEKVYSTTD